MGTGRFDTSVREQAVVTMLKSAKLDVRPNNVSVKTDVDGSSGIDFQSSYEFQKWGDFRADVISTAYSDLSDRDVDRRVRFVGSVQHGDLRSHLSNFMRVTRWGKIYDPACRFLLLDFHNVTRKAKPPPADAVLWGWIDIAQLISYMDTNWPRHEIRMNDKRYTRDTWLSGFMPISVDLVRSRDGFTFGTFEDVVAAVKRNLPEIFVD